MYEKAVFSFAGNGVRKISYPLNHDFNAQNICMTGPMTKAYLTLKEPITTTADEKFCDIFLNFRKI